MSSNLGVQLDPGSEMSTQSGAMGERLTNKTSPVTKHHHQCYKIKVLILFFSNKCVQFDSLVIYIEDTIYIFILY
jgi:hypothetical protein